MRLPGLAMIAALLVGCPRAPLAPPRAPVDTTLAAPVDGGADVPVDVGGVDAPAALVDVPAAAPTSPTRVAAWTDPAAVAALAVSCNYAPSPPPEDDGNGPDPMTCNGNLIAQSCDFDPCEDGVDVPCRTQCGRTCGACDARCRVSCRQCRTACRDDACLRACATTCGACLEGCIDGRDHCLTAVCTARYQACARRTVTHYRQGPCLATCAACQTECADRDRVGECVDACARRRGGCTATERRICQWHGVSYGLTEQ